MKVRLLAVTAALVLSFATIEESYACGGGGGGGNQPPVAVLVADPDHVTIGKTVVLNGSYSYDPDGSIVKYEWDFDNNGVYDYYETSSYHTDGEFDGKTTWIYNEEENKTVKLRVTDDQSDTRTDTVVVHTICTYYVSPDGSNYNDGLSWPTAFATIQHGIDVADYYDYDVVKVNKGTYCEAIDFKGKRCTVTSTDPNDPCTVAATIIDANSSDANAVTFKSFEREHSVLKGFTITGGGRGIYCKDASPAISNCVIKGNKCAGDGGGMWNNDSSSPTISNCFFVENEAGYGGGLYNFSSLALITNCVFGKNTARDGRGGGVYNHISFPRFINCTLNRNDANEIDGYGGAVYNEASSPVFENCIVWGNTAYTINQIFNDNND